jgi:hypothetical protein
MTMVTVRGLVERRIRVKSDKELTPEQRKFIESLRKAQQNKRRVMNSDSPRTVSNAMIPMIPSIQYSRSASGSHCMNLQTARRKDPHRLAWSRRRVHSFNRESTSLAWLAVSLSGTSSIARCRYGFAQRRVAW